MIQCKTGSTSNNIHPPKVIETDVAFVWGLNQITGNNPSRCCGFSNDLIYILSDEGNKFQITFYKVNGQKEKTVVINKGKGPGEVKFNFFFKIRDNRMFFYDWSLKKIAIYDIEGKPIDDILLPAELGYVQDFDYYDGIFYLHDALNNKIMKLNQNGEVVSKIGYEEGIISKSDFFTFPVRFGRLLIDQSDPSLYLGYYNLPYRIEKYDLNLNKRHTITKKVSDSYYECKWLKRDKNVSLSGNMMVETMAIYNQYLYIPFGEGYTYDQNGLVPYHVENTLFVFDKNSGKYVCDIWNKKLKNSSYGYYVLGVNKEYIILLSMYDSSVAEDYASQEERDNNYAWIFVLKNKIN